MIQLPVVFRTSSSRHSATAKLAFALVSIVFLSACAVPAPLVIESPEEVVVGPTSWSDVESVDLGEFPETLPVVDARVEHDVPAPLMNSTADDGTIVEVDGYRVQIFSSAEREETADSEDAVRRWLSGLSEGQQNAWGLSGPVQVYTLYRSPYYRVRVGDFERRDRAVRLAEAMNRSFPGALVVPDRVTVIR